MTPRLANRLFFALTLVACLALAGRATAIDCAAPGAHDWPMYGHDARRTAFNLCESKITRATVSTLLPKWVFHAGDAITASPVVINFDHFGGPQEPAKKVAYVGSADEKFYAIDAADGSKLWEFKADPAPTVGYNMFVSSAYVDRGRNQLYIGGGFTMYALDLFTGAVNWKWSTAARGGGEIESSPVLVGDKVYFGTDHDGSAPNVTPRYPAVFALEADKDLPQGAGRLAWYWRPSEIGSITGPGCGDVWASISVDEPQGLLYLATSDCGGSHQGAYNEAVVALPIAPAPSSLAADLKRNELPNWYFQPRDVDPYDYDFGSTPLLFDGPAGEKYVGIGGKDGSYYVMRRELSATPGAYRPLTWSTRVVRGGFAAGFIGSSATDGTRIYGATALFDIPGGPNPLLQPPYLHAFNALGPSGSNIAWQQIATGPTFGATTAVPGVVFVGNTAGLVNAVDAETGQVLWVWPVPGAVSSGAAISDGELFIGSGTTAKAYGLGQGQQNALNAFSLVAGLPAIEQPPLPPASWPFGVLTYEPLFPDKTTPAAIPTP